MLLVFIFQLQLPTIDSEHADDNEVLLEENVLLVSKSLHFHLDLFDTWRVNNISTEGK